MDDEGADRPGISDAAGRIADHDAASVRPRDRRTRAQWNVPLGVTPHIPPWMAVVFVGGIVIAVVLGVLALLGT